MIIEFGTFSLIIACLFSGLNVGTLLFIPFRNLQYINQIIRRFTILQFLFLGVAFIILVYAFITSNLSIALVAYHSHPLKPLIYKITGTWANYEGSMMLWILELSAITALFTVFTTLGAADKIIILVNQSIIIGIFLLFIIYTSNPFVRIAGNINEGLGLNPLLQDIGLTIHPPILYLGYTSCSIPFSLAILGLLRGNFTLYMAQLMRPWITIAWISLGAGIGLGSWWAYREFGWGGFWFWDPVENLSLMPWLACTALLHSIIVCSKHNTLKIWSIFLALITFCLSLLGTFLVRSGILVSIHSFTNDTGRSIFILMILTFLTIISLLIFALKASKIKSSPIKSLLSKTGLIILGNLLLTYGCFVIMWGTLYPIFYQLFTGRQISVGEQYFSITFLPIVPLILLLAALAPSFRWQQNNYKMLFEKYGIMLMISIIFIIPIYHYLKIHNIFSILALLASNMLVISMCMLFLERVQIFTVSINKAFSNILTLPLPFITMILAHIAFAIMVIAITLNINLRQEVEEALQIGAVVSLAGYQTTLKKINYGNGPNYFYKRANLYIEQHSTGNEIASLSPEIRFYPVEQTKTTESSIYSTLSYDIYSILGDSSYNNITPIKLYYQPMINWLWGSIMLITISGILAIIGHITSIKLSANSLKFN